MKLYISDVHFGHRAAIDFDHRPFADVEGTNRYIYSIVYVFILL